MAFKLELVDWRPMSEAPKDGTRIIVIGLDCDGRGGYWTSMDTAKWKWMADKSQSDWDSGSVAYPLAWRPLKLDGVRIPTERGNFSNADQP